MSSQFYLLEGLVEAVEAARDVVEAHKLFCRNTLKLKPGQSGILSNGRLIGPFEDGEKFSEEDFNTLELFELSSHSRALIVFDIVASVEIANLEADYDTASFRNNAQMKVASLLRRLPAQQRIVIPSVDDPPHSRPPAGAHFTVPHSLLLSSFYRYVLEPELQFTAVGGLSTGPQAVFATVPEQPLYTANLDIPHAWLVESVWALHDLDNIRLAELDHGVHGDFELEHVLVEGHCSDSTTSSPTPGLQFVLGTEDNPERFDTIVMANLGYFQFKANPGVWQMQLRGGRSADIYHIVSHDAVIDPDSEDKVHVAVDGLGGKFVILYVGKKEGKEKEKLLADEGGTDEEDEEEEGGLWSSLFGKEEKPEVPYAMAPNERIHVFSLASGHLYERFLRIMILSVVKNTQSKVKFWFLKNFLSPSFKELMPHYAERYQFEYEYVQYKWPSWLHHQTEKQRIIWGYKILFLDVLFPLNVKKIIFVDADQIVRADLKELVELPLGGAPYGYTPFCDSRTEMEGFRFWKKGYWKNHLGHRKYHISALYVIDLMRFRQLAAGDRLRGQYQALSQDPNSLSNLDQDLPNNMIHQVPIKSLPQEWLWCETWCSDESKAQAKTIDLCNNPLTKEPKLASAVRIVAEWSDYDNEIRQFQESIASKLALPLPSYSGTTPPPPTDSPDSDGHEQAHKEL